MPWPDPERIRELVVELAGMEWDLAQGEEGGRHRAKAVTLLGTIEPMLRLVAHHVEKALEQMRSACETDDDSEQLTLEGEPGWH